MQNVNKQTRILRLEPDFIVSGAMTLTVLGSGYAQGADVSSDAYTFDSTTEFIPLHEQRRIMQLRFDSNVVGGNFQAGKHLTLIDAGDSRG
jgi:hypothetical protein